jgi:hypothetical protein
MRQDDPPSQMAKGVFPHQKTNRSSGSEGISVFRRERKRRTTRASRTSGTVV